MNLKRFELLRRWLVELRLEPHYVTEIMNAVQQIAKEYATEVANEAVRGARMEAKTSATPAPAQQAASPDARMKKALIDGVMGAVTPQIQEFVLSEVQVAIAEELVNLRDTIRGQIARELDAAVARSVEAELDKRIKDLPPAMKKWAERDHAA